MRRLLAAAAALLALAACGGVALPGVPGKSASSSSGPAPSNCATLVAQAIASPSSQVAGSYACLAGNEKEGLTNATGKSGDEAFQALAAEPPVLTVARYAGVTADGGYTYLLDGKDDKGKPTSVVFVAWLDNNGKVVAHRLLGRPE